MIKKLFSASAYSLFPSRSLSVPVLTSFALIVVLLSVVNSAAQDQPTIAKDSVQVTAFTLSSYKKDFKVFSWVPKLNLRQWADRQRQPDLRRVHCARRRRVEV